ncbi:MAG: methionyl-tRNA formyltransferase [Candidatus Hydrogenedentes bacterium]|nr:methionyl-tRNA formyltransferase [Candidatus Hydrogenedentota bacterium]
MRVVFFGTPELAIPSLDAISQRHDLCAIVCQPDRPQGRSSRLVAPPAKEWAMQHGVPVAQPVKLNDGSFEVWLREQRPDIAVLVAYGRFLKPPILAVPAHGIINLHPSLLPLHRGPSPIQTAVLNGDEMTGVTIMRLDEGMDSGDILLQETASIAFDDTTESLSQRLAAQGAALLVRGLDLIASGAAVYTPQDHARATFTKLYEKSDGRIDWSRSARDIHNLVRAAIPWPVAFCKFRGETLRVHRTSLIGQTGQTGSIPGAITHTDKDCLLVATGDGLLAIHVVQAPGKRAMPVADFLRGHSIHAGEHLESE